MNERRDNKGTVVCSPAELQWSVRHPKWPELPLANPAPHLIHSFRVSLDDRASANDPLGDIGIGSIPHRDQ
jgi:hypothetical protein